MCRYAYNLYIMRHHRFTWKGYKDSFTSLITNSPAFQFNMFEIARIRKEMTTLVDNLSKVYLRWLKEQELADRTDDVNPVMPNVPRVSSVCNNIPLLRHGGDASSAAATIISSRSRRSSTSEYVTTPMMKTAAMASANNRRGGGIGDAELRTSSLHSFRRPPSLDPPGSPDPANSAADDAEDMWELTKIYTLNELKKSKPIKCSNKDCDLVACSQWESTDGGKPWNSCLDCQTA